MLSECLHYQGKVGFLIEFLKWYFSKYWQVQTRQIFAQTVTYTILLLRQPAEKPKIDEGKT